MFNGWLDGLLVGIKTINNILTAGIAITAFSLFLYALSFNLRDRVARSFAIILLCVVVVFTTEALQNKSIPDWGIELLLRLQWVGIIFLPASYLHLSDALLVTAGRPSRGRRRLAVRLVYVVSLAFLVLLIAGLLVGPLMPNGQPAPHLQRTAWTDFFTVYYMAIMIWAGGNFIRAFARMLTRSGQRRMLYLMAGATAPALGSYPYLLFGSDLAARYPLFFWSTALVINMLVAILIIIMAYAVAFFGVSWPVLSAASIGDESAGYDDDRTPRRCSVWRAGVFRVRSADRGGDRFDVRACGHFVFSDLGKALVLRTRSR
jgi:hypothetical protein